MTEEFRPQAGRTGLTLDLELPDELPLIESDPSRVRQILGNLIANAVKYTERGGATVRVGLRECAAVHGARRWVAVDIADTGPGIPVEERHLPFREFTRVGPEREEGAGLGLSISQRLARLLGGGCMPISPRVGRGVGVDGRDPGGRAHRAAAEKARPRP